MLARNRDFRFFFAATLIGTIGEGIFGLTSIVSVAKATGSNLSIGVAFALTTLPALLFAPFQGALIDRFNKARLATWATIIRALLISIIATAMWFNVLVSVFLYTCILLYYVLWYFSIPVIESLLVDVLPGESAVRGMSLTQAALQAGVLGAALVAGFLMETFGEVFAFGVAIAMDLVSSGLYHRVRARDPGRLEQAVSRFAEKVWSYAGELRQGWSYVLSDSRLLMLVLTAAAAHPFFQAINTLIVPFNYKVLNGQEFSLGLVDSGAGVGSLISAGVCLWLSRSVHRLLLISELLLGVAIVAFSLTRTIPLAFAGYVVVGLLAGNMKVLAKSLVIQSLRPELSGRVMSAISFIGLGAGLVTALGAGLIADTSIAGAYAATALFVLLPLAATAVYVARGARSAIEPAAAPVKEGAGGG